MQSHIQVQHLREKILSCRDGHEIQTAAVPEIFPPLIRSALNPVLGEDAFASLVGLFFPRSRDRRALSSLTFAAFFCMGNQPACASN